ncbi:hypothetical protein [Rhizobium ruizarguesonis]|uniref:hypothetical protein n=1 Tax=Rhizobium ruizarguesonis TaxID=2081791 RepID=UPI0010305DB8|nr:hypothetical protein [Rhizobium ruizarguesonis]TBD25565.1 hypothetical protein ELH19_31645 [Rhizobium ruizarguesonis]TBD32471.1 hypothetical protein ELH18_30085 [Rhizobium ruizarguesonis]TBD51225.1 hypothetical protein ELH15_33530 [Rhizobium ruizarguesonis]TBD73506.1 hypothetical protein ELH14_32700 [Rhizobium ruizarguesonis]TBD74060.1 hypothetical protein ELH13_31100 [Rhizobium ruizarguesonis]
MEGDVADDETLLGVSAVYLFGRQLSDLILRGSVYKPLGVPKSGKNNFLRRQLGADDAALARIYAFSFEGAFIELARPAIFVVHGSGADPDGPPPNAIAYDRLSRSPGSSARTGLGSQIGALAKDMRVWVYDKGDLSMRLDAETGTFEQILLSAEVSADPRGTASGGLSRSGGALSRSGGVMSRSGGFIPRRSGDGD